MSTCSHEIEKRIDSESKKTFHPRTRRTKLDPERRRRLYELRRIGGCIGNVWKDAGLLVAGSLSARTIGTYDPSHNLNPQPSRITRGSRIDLSWTQRLPGLPTTLDFISQCSERARMQIAERLSKHRDLENMMVMEYPWMSTRACTN